MRYTFISQTLFLITTVSEYDVSQQNHGDLRKSGD